MTKDRETYEREADYTGPSVSYYDTFHGSSPHMLFLKRLVIACKIWSWATGSICEEAIVTNPMSN